MTDDYLLYTKLGERLREAVRKYQPARPLSPNERLFHYTDARAFKSIIDSGRLWATDIRFMNDASEYTYGLELLVNEIEKQLAENPEEIHREVLTVMKQAYAPTNNPFLPLALGFQRVYVTCFSSNGDLLSQWRGYDASDGYAVGFRAELLDSIEARVKCRVMVQGEGRPVQGETYVQHPVAEVEATLKPQLLRVVYDAQQQIRIFSDVLDEAMRFAVRAAAVGGASEVANSIAHAAREAVCQAIFAMKHPSFLEEQEWRLVYRLPAFPNSLEVPEMPAGSDFEGRPVLVSTRAANGHLVPYLDVRLDRDVGLNGLPIGKVIVGPTATPELAAMSTRTLLLRNGYEASVVNSSIPLRTSAARA